MINYKKTILIIILILLIFFGYWFFFLSKNNTGTNTNTNTNVNPQNKVSNTQYDKEFVSSLLGLNSVELNVSIFQTPAYQALSYPEKPFVVNYIRESGRFNPFLPIGVEGNNPNANNQVQEVVAPADTEATSQPTVSTSTNPKPILKKF